MNEIIQKWLSPVHLRSLLLDSENTKQTCVQIARFCAAYYLDYFLFIPPNGQQLPSLYIWGCMENESDLPPNSTLLDRTTLSQMLPPEYSPALPALLLAKCDHLIEAINYVDHFDDKRSGLILRLLADSVHQKDLTIEYVKSMIAESVPLEIERILKGHASFEKFNSQICQSILELDVCLQKDLLIFFEENLLHTSEYLFSQLPLQSSNISNNNFINPIFDLPPPTTTSNSDSNPDSDEETIFSKIHYNCQIILNSLAKSNRLTQQLTFTLKLVSASKDMDPPVPNSSQKHVLHRLLLLHLRIKYRSIFTDSLRCNDKNLPKIADRYKLLLNEDDGECALLKKWANTASEEEMEEVEWFFEHVQGNFKQSCSLPPMSTTTREIWLRRIVLNNSTDHRDVRQERVIDWFRTICHPKHRVCDFVISQMLLINSQWTSPGFSFITPGCHALRLSIHPHDLCLGTNTVSANYSLSARDILYTSPSEAEAEDSFNSEEKLFTPREYQRSNGTDLISKYAKRHNEMMMAKSSRPFSAIDERIREFSKQQGNLQKELEREREFLMSRSSIGSYHHQQNHHQYQHQYQHHHQSENQTLARQIAILTEKLDNVVQSISESKKETSMYIKEDDEESVISELPFNYGDAPVHKISPLIEKLDFDQLTSRQDDLREAESLASLETANSIENPIFSAHSFENPFEKSQNHQPEIPLEWMKLLPLDLPSPSKNATSFADNLLIYDGKTPRVQPLLAVSGRKAVSERGSQTMEMEIVGKKYGIQTQTEGLKEEVGRKFIGTENVKKMSREDIDLILNRVK